MEIAPSAAGESGVAPFHTAGVQRDQRACSQLAFPTGSDSASSSGPPDSRSRPSSQSAPTGAGLGCVVNSPRPWPAPPLGLQQKLDWPADVCSTRHTSVRFPAAIYRAPATGDSSGQQLSWDCRVTTRRRRGTCDSVFILGPSGQRSPHSSGHTTAPGSSSTCSTDAARLPPLTPGPSAGGREAVFPRLVAGGGR